MKKTILILLLVSCVFALFSCTKQMYSYKDYDEATYSYFVMDKAKDLKKISKSYEKIVSAKANKKKSDFDENRIPPGACADYAYLLLQQKDTTQAYIWLEKEVELFPESKPYVESLKRDLGL